MRPGRNEQWVRVTFVRTSAHRFNGDLVAWGDLILSEIALYDGNGKRVNVGLRKTSGSTAAELRPGEYLQVMPVGADPGSANGYCLFDDNEYTGWIVRNWTTSGDDSARWVSLTMRLSEDAEPVCAYNFRAASSDYHKWHGIPDDFFVEVSSDGRNWTVADSRQQAYTDAAAEALAPFFPQPAELAAASPLPLSSPVFVAAGAVLDVAPTVEIGALEVRCGEDAGGVTAFNLAERGAVDLVGETPSFPFELPYSFGSVTNGDRAQDWQVKVNGRADGRLRLVVEPDGAAFVKEIGGLILWVK